MSIRICFAYTVLGARATVDIGFVTEVELYKWGLSGGDGM